jgi:cysteine protease ATG4
MADSEFARYGKKFVNYFWDPLPRNQDASGTPIICLGVSYDNHPPPSTAPPSTGLDLSQSTVPSPSDSSASRSYEAPSSEDIEEISKSEIEKDIIASQDSSANGKHMIDEGGWPPAFLDDFESRIWFTYRSGFAPIAKSQDPKALAAMSFAVRIRQIASQEGFTSDTGWGCMIRTGQSLLANALFLLELGRGMFLLSYGLTELTRDQIGDVDYRLTMKDV